MATPLDLIACPVCHAELSQESARWHCPACKRHYGAVTGLDLTPNPPPDDEVCAQWPLWEQLQSNFLAAATAVPEHSLSVTERPDADAFARFCALAGTVLDVGCGTQRHPTYADTAACRFVGLDPLPGERERDFEFVMGLGEYLPFRTDSVDQVLFATSLDHMLVPRRALAEAGRVIRPDGAVNVWFGELDRPPTGLLGRALRRVRALRPTPVEPEPDYIARLEQPDGAIDKFHVAHPDADAIAGWFTDAGLELSDLERIDYNHGCFIRAVKPAAP